MFNSPTRAGFSKFARVLENANENKMAAPNNAFYVLTQNHSGLPNSVLFNSEFDTRLTSKDTDNLSEGSINLYFTDGRAETAISNQDAYVKNTGDIITGDLTVEGKFNIGSIAPTSTTKQFSIVDSISTQMQIETTSDVEDVKYLAMKTAGTARAWAWGMDSSEADRFSIATDINTGPSLTSDSVFTISTAGDFDFKGGSLTATGPILGGGAGHDQFSDFVANEHIDWTNASDDFKTSGEIDVGKITSTDPVWIGDSADGTFRVPTPISIAGEYFDMSSAGVSRGIIQGTTPLLHYVKTNGAANEKLMTLGIIGGEYFIRLANDVGTAKVNALKIDLTQGDVTLGADLKVVGKAGFNNAIPITKPSVADLPELLAAMDDYGLIDDNS